MTATTASPNWPGPSRDDLDEGDQVIQITGEMDNLGRVQFFAYWLEDYLTPLGVRGQVFDTNLAEFVERNEHRRLRPWDAYSADLLVAAGAKPENSLT